MRTRRCDICKTPLAGRKGHGFVINNGKNVICGDYKRHNRMKSGRKWSYDLEETRETEETKA